MSADKTIDEILAHHGASMAKRDLDAVMSDYAADAVLIDPMGVSRGAAAIRRAFQGLLGSGVPLDPPTRVVTCGEVAYLEWKPAAGKPGRLGAETLIVRDGRIVLQTVAEFGGPPPGAPPR